MPSLPEPADDTFYTAASFQRPYYKAWHERMFAMGLGESPYEAPPAEEDMVGEMARVLTASFGPSLITPFFKESIADGVPPEELDDKFWITDTPGTPDTSRGIWSGIDFTGPAAIRLRPVEFLSPAQPLVRLEDYWIPDSQTREPTAGEKGRCLADGKVYTFTGSVWVIDDPQSSPPDLMEIEIGDEWGFYQRGDVIIKDIWEIYRRCAGRARWTMSEPIAYWPASITPEMWSDPPEGMFEVSSSSRFDVFGSSPGLLSNTWVSRTFGPGDLPASPGPSAAFATLLALASARATDHPFGDPTTGMAFFIPVYVGLGSQSQFVSDPYASTYGPYDPIPPAENVWVTPPPGYNTLPLVDGVTMFYTFEGAATQTKHEAVHLVANTNVETTYTADPRLVDLGMSRSVEVWGRGIPIDLPDTVFDTGDTLTAYWASWAVTTSDKASFNVTLWDPPAVPFPSTLTITELNPGAPAGTFSRQSSEAACLAGFGAEFQAGITRWNVEDGFEYPD